MKLIIEVEHNANPHMQPIIHNAIVTAAKSPAWEIVFIDREASTHEKI
jgi:hypothetical protein